MVPIGPEWPSCYFHPDLKLMLVIYVDDFKLSGPIGNLAAGWKLLRKDPCIEPEERYGEKGTTYLGCKVLRTTAKLCGSQMATVITYDMEEFLHSRVQQYLELSGDKSVNEFPIPFIPENTPGVTGRGSLC